MAENGTLQDGPTSEEKPQEEEPPIGVVELQVRMI